MAGFFKKLVKGVNKAVGSIAGVASKILPAPLGTAAKAVQGISGFGDKLLGGDKKASASASVGAAAAASSAVLPTPPGIALPGSSSGSNATGGESWFKKNLGWVIPSGLAVLGLLAWLIFGKRK